MVCILPHLIRLLAKYPSLRSNLHKLKHTRQSLTTRLSVPILINTSLSLSLSLYIYTYNIYIYIYIYIGGVCVGVYVCWGVRMYVNMNVCMCVKDVYTYHLLCSTHFYVYVCMYVGVYVCMYVCRWMDGCV